MATETRKTRYDADAYYLSEAFLHIPRTITRKNVKSINFPSVPTAITNYYPIRFLDSRWTLKLVTLLIFAIHSTIGGLLIAHDHFNMHMFTYWQYTALWAFFAFLLVALFVEGTLMSFLCLYAVPLVYTTVPLVYLIILIIIAIDGTVYIKDTECDPAGGGKIAIGTVHTADHFIHTFPLLELLILLVFDFKPIIRANYLHFARTRPWWHFVLYTAFFLLSPLVLFGVYCAIFDPLELYTDKLALWEMWLIALGLDLAVASLWWIAFMQSPQRDLHMWNYYKSKRYRESTRRRS